MEQLDLDSIYSYYNNFEVQDYFEGSKFILDPIDDHPVILIVNKELKFIVIDVLYTSYFVSLYIDSNKIFNCINDTKGNQIYKDSCLSTDIHCMNVLWRYYNGNSTSEPIDSILKLLQGTYGIGGLYINANEQYINTNLNPKLIITDYIFDNLDMNTFDTLVKFNAEMFDVFRQIQILNYDCQELLDNWSFIFTKGFKYEDDLHGTCTSEVKFKDIDIINRIFYTDQEIKFIFAE